MLGSVEFDARLNVLPSQAAVEQCLEYAAYDVVSIWEVRRQHRLDFVVVGCFLAFGGSLNPRPISRPPNFLSALAAARGYVQNETVKFGIREAPPIETLGVDDDQTAICPAASNRIAVSNLTDIRPGPQGGLHFFYIGRC